MPVTGYYFLTGYVFLKHKKYICRVKHAYMKFIGIIPARFRSVRFPGKPLALIHGKPMIQWVVSQAEKALEHVWVATDHEDIFKTVKSFGGKVLMTSPDHQSGTDRCAEAAGLLSGEVDFEVVINIQGDEPFIRPEQIRELMSCFTPGVGIATLIRKITSQDELENPNKPKVVVDKSGEALYFSRAVIPFLRGTDRSDWAKNHVYWAHIGMYGYHCKVLQQLTKLTPSVLEMAESLEQLRWLENGFRIKTAVTGFQGIGIDTPEDLEFAVSHFRDFCS
jgi:3-deoxy-manno-octulosonate cytidylyltransferase (CMP-KDO synthetase)